MEMDLRKALVVAGEWPRRLNCGGSRHLSLSLAIRKLDHTWALAAFGSRLPSPLLELAGPLLLSVGGEAYATAYYARVELPRDFAATQPWPRRYETVGHFADFVSWLQTAIADQHGSGPGSIYPITTWLLPATNSRLENLVDLFRLLPFDDGVYEEILAEGAVRISIALTYGDILAAEQYAERVLGWLEAARRDHDLVWEVGPYTSL